MEMSVAGIRGISGASALVEAMDPYGKVTVTGTSGTIRPQIQVQVRYGHRHRH
jgi:hypothetical protein